MRYAGESWTLALPPGHLSRQTPFAVTVSLAPGLRYEFPPEYLAISYLYTHIHGLAQCGLCMHALLEHALVCVFPAPPSFPNLALFAVFIETIVASCVPLCTGCCHLCT